MGKFFVMTSMTASYATDYAKLEINLQALNSLPADGVPSDHITVETEHEIASADNAAPDLRPPTQNSSEDIVYDNSTQMSSFYLLVSNTNRK